MAKSVNISFNVNTAKAVANLLTVQNTLVNIRNNINAINKMQLNPKIGNNLANFNNNLANMGNNAKNANNNINNLIMNMQKINIIINNNSNNINNFNNGLNNSTSALIRMQAGLHALSAVSASLGWIINKTKKHHLDF